MTPKRIQRKRKKGWRMPPGAIIVSRPSKWGNPYKIGGPDPMMVGHTMTAEDTVRMFRWYLESRPDLVAAAQQELAGKDLVCWCALDAPCHGDVWLEVANL